ncbi:hypothetical protein N2152v2_001615 [Parachlorella kessleri]
MLAEAAKLQHAVSLFVNSTLGRAWRAWVAFVDKRHQQQAALARTLNWWRLQVQAKALRMVSIGSESEGGQGQAGMLRRAEQRDKLLVAATKLCNRLLLSSWNAWRLHACNKQLLRSTLQHAVQQWTNARLRAGFAAFMSNHERVGRAKAAVARWQQAAISKAFKVWQHMALVRAVGFFRNGTLARAFSAWACYSAYSHDTARVLAQAVNRWSKKNQASCLAAWRAATQRRVYGRKVITSALARMQNRLLAAAFGAWQTWVSEHQRQKEQLTTACLHWHSAALAAAFSTWREISEQQKLRREQLGLALQRWKGNMLRAALAGWMEKCHSLRDKRTKVQAAVKMWQLATLRAAMEGWKIHVAFMLKAKQAAVQRWSLAAQSNAFWSWRQCAEERRSNRQKMRSILNKITDSHLLAALHTLRRKVHLASYHREAQLLRAGFAAFKRPLHRKAALEVAVLRMLHRQLAGAWAAWKELADQSRERQALAAEAGAKAVSRIRHHTLWSAWGAWQANIKLIRTMRYLLGRIQLRHVLAAFNSWRQWVQRAQQAKALLHKVLAKAVAFYFAKWREASEAAAEERLATIQLDTAAQAHALQRHRLRFAVSFWGQAALHRAWKAWRQFASTKVELALKAKEALAYWTGNTLKVAFLRWKEFTLNKMTEAALADQARQHYLTMLQRKALLALADYWLWRQEKALKLYRTQGHMNGYKLLAALYAWRQAYLRRVLKHIWFSKQSQAFAAWKEMAASCKRLRRLGSLAVQTYASRSAAQAVLLRMRHIKIAAAFAAWVEHRTSCQHKQGLIRKAASFFTGSALSRAFATWREAAAELRLHGKAVRHGDRVTLLKAYVSWQAVAHRKQQLQVKGSMVTKQWLNRHLATAFHGWVASVEHRVQLRVQNLLLGKAFATWQAWTARKRLAQRVGLAFQQRLLHQAWQTWVQSVEDVKLEGAASRHSKAMLLRAFHKWQAYSVLVQVKREKHHKAAVLCFGSMQLKDQLVLRTWGGWQAVAAQKARLRRCEAQLANAVQRRVLARLLLRWRRTAQGCRFLRHCYLRRGLQGWRESVTHNLEKKRELRGVMHVLLHSCTARCFVAWRELAQIMGIKRAAFCRKQAGIKRALEIGDAIIAQRRRALAAAVLSTWRYRTKTGKEVQRRFAHYLRGSLQGAWGSWRRYHVHKDDRRKRVAMAQDFHSSWCLQQALNTWRETVNDNAAELERKLQLATSFAFENTMGYAFLRWVRFVELRRRQRQKLAAVFEMVISEEESVLVRRCWAGWQAALAWKRQTAAQACVLAARQGAKLVQEVFNVWWSYTRAMRADPDPDSPFLSPRLSHADSDLVWGVAEGLAALTRADSSASSLQGGSQDRCGKGNRSLSPEESRRAVSGIDNSQARMSMSRQESRRILNARAAEGSSTAAAAVEAPAKKKDEVDHVALVLDAIADPRKVVVVQTAPAVRVSIGEECGMEPGSVTTGQLVTVLKKLGFDYVYDTLVAADLTIMEEGFELMTRLKAHLDGKPDPAAPLPMFTSCCPGWVFFVEQSNPELIPHVSSCKSPQMMMGAVLKAYFSHKMGVDPRDLVVASIMPCVRKQGEADRIMFHTNSGAREVDHVITTRELGALIKEGGIDFASLTESPFDDLLDVGSGAAAIFGTTGGVMEAALRTVYEVATGNKMERLPLQEVRGLEGIREATVTITPHPEGPLHNKEPVEVNVAVANGLGNAKKILTEVKEGRKNYHFVEVMACPGGCIGGGGQPRSKDKDILKKRQAAIYGVDERSQIRRSYENPVVQHLYEAFLGEPLSHEAHKLLHTFYVAGGPDKFDYAKAKEEEEARQAQGPAVSLGTKGEDFTNAPLCTFGGTCDFDDETGVFLDSLLAEDATH